MKIEDSQEKFGLSISEVVQYSLYPKYITYIPTEYPEIAMRYYVNEDIVLVFEVEYLENNLPNDGILFKGRISSKGELELILHMVKPGKIIKYNEKGR